MVKEAVGHSVRTGALPAFDLTALRPASHAVEPLRSRGPRRDLDARSPVGGGH